MWVGKLQKWEEMGRGGTYIKKNMYILSGMILIK